EKTARRASQLGSLHQKNFTIARCAASSGASRTFKVHHARRADRTARRAGAKSI
ncbi:hypothetical protein A2U01_0059546, partial [Trifolium medium]|nr:hypothetical protein [Trifolium medium]